MHITYAIMLAVPSDNTPAIKPPNRRGGRPFGSTKSKLTKEQLEALLAVRLKDKDIPVQYLSAISSTFASLKGWSKNATDDTLKYQINDELRRWARERVYAAGTVSSDELRAATRATLPQDELTALGEGESTGGTQSSVLAAPDAQTGEIPQLESQTEPLIPSHTPTTPENSPLTVANKGDKQDGQG